MVALGLDFDAVWKTVIGSKGSTSIDLYFETNL